MVSVSQFPTVQMQTPATSSNSVTPAPKHAVPSIDINDLICGPEEFPPRMLEADYDQYVTDESTSVSSQNSNQLVGTYL